VDGCRLGDEAKGLIKINTWLLGKTSNNPAGLVQRKSTSGVELVLEDHFHKTTLAPGGHGTRVHVPLAIRASYSSVIAARQEGSWRAIR
jgi:hypothetical protein